jgi:phospholipid transport system substrate-binding protein
MDNPFRSVGKNNRLGFLRRAHHREKATDSPVACTLLNLALLKMLGKAGKQMGKTTNSQLARAGSVALGAALALSFALLTTSAPAHAGAPTEQIQGAIEKALAILKDPKLQSEAKRKELKEAVYPKFDFAEMARRSLGSHWQRRSADEQREFVKVFTELIENAYMSNIEGYNGEKVVIGTEKQDKDFAEVDTKVITKKGEEISVNYKLRQAGNDWKVYDVVIENISLVNNYRSQFNRVIAQSSYEELFRKMKDKQFDAAGKKRSS